METFQIYKNLALLNELPADEAGAAFLDCCGSPEWVRRMVEARPFSMIEVLYEKAETAWFSLSKTDWLEAFAANVQVGSDDWPLRHELAAVNGLYRDKFGFIFVLCTVRKTDDEILAICRARFGNSVETEFKIAAEEQWKTIELRLSRLLEQ